MLATDSELEVIPETSSEVEMISDTESGMNLQLKKFACPLFYINMFN